MCKSNRFLVGLVLFAILAAASSFVNAGPIRKDYPVTKLTDRIYVIYGPYELPSKENQGFRNNPAFVVTSAGVIVVDPGSGRNVGEMVLNKIRTITDKPVVAVFDTHSHGDHFLGNDAIKRAFPKAVIYGHPNMKAALDAGEGGRWVKIMEKETQGETAGTVAVGLDKLVNDGDDVRIGDRQFRIHHFGNAHTDNDIVIEDVEDKVAFVGDIVRVRALGSEDGSFKGNIEAIEKTMTLPVTIFLPGHGPAGGREELAEYKRYLEKFYAAVQKFYKQGLADYEMKPKVIDALKEYRSWDEFDTWIGPQVSTACLEVEKDSF